MRDGFSYLFCSLSHQEDIRTRKQCKYLIEQHRLQQNTLKLFSFSKQKKKKSKTENCDALYRSGKWGKKKHVGPAQFGYSPLFIQFLLHHVPPPGWHRCQASGLLLSLHVDTGVKGNMGGDGGPCSSVKDLH